MAGKKLLVADDSLTIQKVIRLALSNEGYEIQAISDGAEAIQQIATFRPDAVLIDVSLPTRTAFEIKREVNEMADHPEMKFILMSSAFEKIDEAQARDVGFDGRLTKPFDPAHLRQVLTEVLSAPSKPPSTLPPLPADEPAFTSTGIRLEPPRELPPSDFDFESADDLWGKHEESPQDDIKHLTESTIRLSGLADFSENDAQNPPPLPTRKTAGDHEPPSPPAGSKDDFDWTVNEPSLKPPGSFADLEGSGFKMFPPPPGRKNEPDAEPGTPPPLPRGSSSFPLTPPPAQDFPADSITHSVEMDARMEETIRRQVEETLEKLTRQILPEVAERVIKEEINRLLNEKF